MITRLDECLHFGAFVVCKCLCFSLGTFRLGSFSFRFRSGSPLVQEPEL